MGLWHFAYIRELHCFLDTFVKRSPNFSGDVTLMKVPDDR